MTILAESFIWNNTCFILEQGKLLAEWGMDLYLAGVGEMYDQIPEPHNQDLYDLKEGVFAGLRFLPYPCIAIPGFPVGPIVYFLT